MGTCAVPTHRAFVVGNNCYQKLRKLDVSVEDAKAMRDLLLQKGYDVTLVENADLSTFNSRFNKFVCSLRSGSTVVVHLSGHGCQVGGVNYFLSVDQAEADAGGACVLNDT